MSLRWIVATCLIVACHQAAPTTTSEPPPADLIAPRSGVVVADEVALTAEQAAANEEAEWYAEDPERRAQVGAAPTGDACRLSYDAEASLFRVGQVPVFFPLGGDVRTRDIDGHDLRIMQLRQGQTLFVAFTNGDVDDSTRLRSGNGMGGPSFADRLWTIDCAQPRPRLYYQASASEEGAVDFGHAVASSTGDALFVSSRYGISRFVIATKTLEDAIPTMRCTPFETFIDSDTNCRRVLLPTAMTEHGLEIIAGIAEANCHGGGPTIEHYLVDVTSEAIRKNPHAWPSPTALAFVQQRGKDLWLAHGDLWRSRDNGATWSTVSLGAADDQGAYSPSPLVMVGDRRQPRRMLVLASSYRLGERLHELFASTDGGNRWRRLERDDDGAPILDVWSVDGTLDHLGIVRGDPYGDEEERETFESRDGGKTWSLTEMTVPKREAALPPGFERTALGLWRSGEPRTLVYPPPNLATPMWIDTVPLDPVVPRQVIDWDIWDRSVAANKRGLGHAKAKRYDEAIAAYTEAWTINPNSAVARYNAACAHALAGNAKAAMALLEELHRMRGYRALTLLAAAAEDKDLTSLRKLARFRILTTASAPSSAFDNTGAMEGVFNVGQMVMSDAAEKLCVWADEAMPVDDNPAVDLPRFDCGGPAKGALQAPSAKDLAGLFDELGMRAWTKIEASSPDYAKAKRWADAAPKQVGAPEVQGLFRSPSGKRVAAYVTGEDKDGEWTRSVVFGDY